MIRGVQHFILRGNVTGRAVTGMAFTRPFPGPPIRPALLPAVLALSLGVASAAQIADGTWTLTRLTDAAGTLQFGGLDAPTLKLLGTSISTAEGTQVSGQAGCNTFRTTGIFMTRTLRLRPIATTRKACAESVMQAETRYLNVLGAARSFVRQGDTLILSTGTARAVFMYGTEAQRRLLTEWRFVGGEGQDPLTVRFSNEGRISGYSGCNTYSGQYDVMDETLSVGPLASTRRACLSPALQTQEQTFLRDLQAVRRFTVAGTQLTLMTETGKQLVFMVPTR